MSTTYGVEVIHLDRECWLTELENALDEELKEVGLHRNVTVEVRESAFSGDDPSVAVYFGTPGAMLDGGVRERVTRVLADGVLVVPIVEDLGRFSECVPDELRPLNGWEWSGQDPARRLARILLEELGIEDRQRRVFISHKREDGLGAAERLFDALGHQRFVPFIDRFAIPRGARVQDHIADALEDHAFLLLLETPQAHDSEWVFDEVDYALSHFMGILIVQWPGNPEPVPGSPGLPRLTLSVAEIESDEHGYQVPSEAALERVLAGVEAAHAVGIVRRRRMLTCSVEDAANAAGCSACVQEGAWRLLVEHAGNSTLIDLTPRLPRAEDLQRLDDARSTHSANPSAMLVHSARILREPLKTHLGWVTGSRDLTLRPENAVGGHWI
jgi:TIR domain